MAPWYTLVFFTYFVFGLCIGSFLNVVIYRLPIGLSIAKGRSMCPKCKHTLGALDLVPVFSFLFLGRKCRYCGEPISWRYMIVELMTAVLFGLCGLRFDISAAGVLYCVYFCVLICAWYIDYDHTYIPDRLHIIIVVLAVCSYFTGPAISIPSRLIGAAVMGIGMTLLSLATGGGIGGGDVKLMAASGLLLGWQLVVPAFFLAYVIAAVRCLPALIKKEMGKGFEVPMAPYFAISLMVFSLYGQALLHLWLGGL